jgi:hypothetical protein
MAYNPTKDVNAGYISPLHKDLLLQLVQTHRRSIRGQLEVVIEQAFINDKGYEYYRAVKEAHEALHSEAKKEGTDLVLKAQKPAKGYIKPQLTEVEDSEG